MKNEDQDKELIIKYREFRCQRMKEFTFTYPTIKGWGEAEFERDTTPNVCIIKYDKGASSRFEGVFPKIIVEKTTIGINDIRWKYLIPLIPLRGLPPQKNPNGIKFGYFETPFRGNWCQFFRDKYSIKVKIQNMEEYPEFEMVFFRKVMETFRFL